MATANYIEVINMNVNIEFFSDDALENIATSLSYNIDKLVFVGYADQMATARKRNLSGLLKNVLNIHNVEYIEVEENNLNDITYKLSSVVEKEQAAGNSCYFNLTGGDDLILVAAGIVAAQTNVPMHQLDLYDGSLSEYVIEEGCSRLSSILRDEPIILSLPNYMKFRGTCINYRMKKSFKTQLDDSQFVADIKNLWQICKKYGKQWNVYGKFFRNNADTPIDQLVYSPFGPTDNTSRVHGLLKELEQVGAISRLRRDEGCFRFKYKSQDIKDCLCDSGSILELYTYLTAMECDFFDSCDIGVHLDWDGIINGWLPDVVNEVDVLLMKDNIPTFISCKNGRVDKDALYELDTVTRKFGGKYALKVIISPQSNDETLSERAREMGIDLIDDEIFDWTEDEFKYYLKSLYERSQTND